MDWKLTDNRPIWQQLTEQLTLRILKGEYPPGERLPGVRELAAQAGVNPNTMQRAMAQLEAGGLAVGSRTAGRTVTENTAVIEAATKEDFVGAGLQPQRRTVVCEGGIEP